MVRKRIPYSPVLQGTVHFSSGSGSDTVDSDGVNTLTFHGSVNLRDGNVSFNGGGATFSAPALLNAGAAQTLRVRGDPTDGATAVSVATDSNSTLATAGAQLHEFRNNTTAKCGVPYFGGYYLGGMTTATINALAGADLREGTMVWDTSLHVPKVYSGTAWKTVTIT